MKKFTHDFLKQEFFDSFNNFINSDDTKIFNKLASKIHFLYKTKEIPGDIIELGVFKGTGIFAWLKALNFFSIKNKKVIGFDLFDEKTLLKSIRTSDKQVMKKLFSQRNFKIKNYEKILIKMLNINNFKNYEIIKGNVSTTVKKYIKKNIGFRVSLVNFDLDLFQPTYDCLKLLWPRLTKGGIFLFDEYAINEWSESDAIDKFIKKKNLKIINTNLSSPTAYIIKN